MDPWIVNILGDPDGPSWEISIVRTSNALGQRSYGWFGEQKLRVSDNGGPYQHPMAPGLGTIMVMVAKNYTIGLNAKERAALTHGKEI